MLLGTDVNVVSWLSVLFEGRRVTTAGHRGHCFHRTHANITSRLRSARNDPWRTQEGVVGFRQGILLDCLLLHLFLVEYRGTVRHPLRGHLEQGLEVISYFLSLSMANNRCRLHF